MSEAPAPEVTLAFDRGTLVLRAARPELVEALPGVRWDDRTSCHRAPARCYRDIALRLHRGGVPYEDQARGFEPQTFELRERFEPRRHQAEALEAWRRAGGLGVVVMPTGAGKTFLAVLCIEAIGRPTLVHVPTIDLMHQWHAVLARAFGCEIGLLGGGYNEERPLTVATYDSALLHVERKGNRFGLAIFDECHHLPGPQLQHTAIASIAPYRLGLTATPERTDGREAVLYDLCGPPCYSAAMSELEGETLAPYDVVTVPVPLRPEDDKAYREARELYVGFARAEGIRLGSPDGWKQFLFRASRTLEGRRALRAYREQKRLSEASEAKLERVWELVQRHREDRVLVFTQDNAMAYRIGGRFFLPVLTHHTKVKEREAFLSAFREGRYGVLVTSKVLNEGVDVPEASVAVVVSGSGTTREHVQRLGRVLRARPGKRAVLYELLSEGTRETWVSERRRQHDAYQRA